MKSSAEAQKLVNYYSSNKLKINDSIIRVAFSDEYRSLLGGTSQGLGPQKTDKDQKQVQVKRQIQRFKELQNPVQIQTKIGEEQEEQIKRRQNVQKIPQNQVQIQRRLERSRTRSKSIEQSSNSSRQNQNKENSKEAEPPREEQQTITADIRREEPAAAGEEEEKEKLEEEDSMSTDEGMEVIAEDGKMIKDEDEESLKEEEDMEEEEQEKKMETEVEEMDVKDAGAEDQEERVKEMSEMKEEEEEETEDAGFPVDLENCITLDEVHSDDQGEGDGGEESELESSRVVSFSSVPQCCTDAELIKVMRGFGTVVRYLLNQQQASVEMSSPSEAQKAAEELNSKCISINGCRLIGFVSRENIRLADGRDVTGDEDEERKSDPRNETSERLEPTNSEPGEAREEAHGKQALEEVVQEGEETPETSQESPSDKTEENETERKPPGRRDTVKRKGAPQNRRGSPKSQRTHEEKITASNAPEVSEDENRPEGQDLQQQRGTEGLSDSGEPEVTDHPETAEQNSEAAPPLAPVGGATEAEKTAKAVGTEFVRPVVGYYCNLCQLIFYDEDEAKGDHCRTPAHYAKYQEKTGKDPWTS
ncbi:RNA-binding protein 20 [Oryzias melastigma]|uniref:RNA-binding protein 20 n=1 Tax=Oryzias melastigma TaxID=30732 RepID=A0A834FPL9_ORYME|nr:RNA-binding protein 20 [Oryzias melastigma]